MSTRREPESNRLEKIGARVRQRALTGTEASTVGFTLVVFIFAGAGLGYLLDQNLETSYWIAIGTVLGAVVGFRQMFAITKKLTRESGYDDDEDNSTSSELKGPAPASKASLPTVANAPVAEEPHPEPAVRRLFSTEVPPPPVPSFDDRLAKDETNRAGNKTGQDEERPE